MQSVWKEWNVLVKVCEDGTIFSPTALVVRDSPLPLVANGVDKLMMEKASFSKHWMEVGGILPKAE